MLQFENSHLTQKLEKTRNAEESHKEVILL